ncbi:hypothetical protein [Flavobacteriaceae bacterium 14752]|uniref:hypothetical protein n=1 Tax=Mesohalobacter salilacus TaxID=2491711 RepID=UPI000F635D4A|nr:hypothetical protein EIG84_08645 [Flavobacteriaceae bacterium 14752]
MKPFFYLLALLCLGFNASGQDKLEPSDSEKRLDAFSAEKRHELSLDVTAALALPALQPRYEYILGRYSGLGADIFIALDSDEVETEELEKLSITPFYRQYFFSKEDYGAKGFYAEGFLKAYTYENDDFIGPRPISERGDNTYFETALGVSIGWKWVSNSGFMIDLGFGIGRNLGFSSEPDELRESVIPRGGVHFGWRF